MPQLPLAVLLPGEERELSRRWKTSCDLKARDRLILSCTGFVRSLAFKLSRANKHLGEELTQEGFLGLIQAVEKYDPVYKNRFATYAQWWILAFMRRYLKKHPVEISLDAPLYEDSDTTLKDEIPDKFSGPENLLGLNTEGDVQLLQQAVIALLHGKQREVIKLRYFSGEEIPSLQSVGESILGRSGDIISREGIRLIEAKAINTLRKGIKNWQANLANKQSKKTHFGIRSKKVESGSFFQAELEESKQQTNPETTMSVIPDKIILDCVEKLGGKTKSVTTREVFKLLCDDEVYSGPASLRSVGQSLRQLVDRHHLEKFRSVLSGLTALRTALPRPQPKHRERRSLFRPFCMARWRMPTKIRYSRLPW
ncbi:MAG: sigma-70 family RNA polymerase sigma factor [Patescibacteria group bacterium]|jgi:RNA polymerase sigma factor (sigma-70 family)